MAAHLTERTQVEAVWLGISRARIHVIPQQQDELQQLTKGVALLHFIAGGINSHDIWTEVVHLLLKLYPEEDVVEARTQPLHTAHLPESKKNVKKNTRDKGEWKKNVDRKRKSEDIINLKKKKKVQSHLPPSQFDSI